jgi:phage tail sheath protein FI
MPEYLSPGVYVEEIDAGPQPIAAVATSTAGAVGVTQRGPATPTLVTSYGDFVRNYGGPIPLPDETTRSSWDARGRWWHAAESVKAFFDEGGSRLYFQRVRPSAAAASSRNLNAGLFALLGSDVANNSRTITLSHAITLTSGASLDLVSGEDGSVLGTVNVTAVDYARRVVTLGADAGVSARSGRDLARISPVNTALNVLAASAASVGVWGDDLAVRILPVVGARLTMNAGPTTGRRVDTATTADAASGTATITVLPVAGSLVPTTPSGFAVRINGGAPVIVTNVAAAGANVGLTLAQPLTAVVPAGSAVQVLRSAVTGAAVTTSGAGRLYPGAIVQLEGLATAEVLRVVAVAGAQVTLSSPPANTYREGDAISVVEADVAVRYRPSAGDEVIERFSGLRLIRDNHPDSLLRRVNAASRLITLTAGPDYDGTLLARFPAVNGAPWAPLGTGADGLQGLVVGDFVGEDLGPGMRTGIQALEDIDEVAICLVPGIYSPDVSSALITHCETLKDRFAILDCPPGSSVQQVQAFRSTIDTKYAALYYPWVEIRDPRPGGDSLIMPPAGFMAGIYARVDVSRGVFKAPANEVIRSIRGFEQSITKREQDILNPQKINVLRFFPGRGNRVWGARVLTSDSAWLYVPVRRLFIMIEESIDEATQWVVFEPNDEPLWARVRQSVTRFLYTQWRLGALQGATADEAFFVVCDRSTMSQAEIDNGQLICLIGIAPVKPAEFVIFRIQQKTLDVVTA